MTDAARNTQDLPKLVGYSQLEKVYGWKKRSLQRAVSAGKLRRPMNVAGGKAMWRHSDSMTMWRDSAVSLKRSPLPIPRNSRPKQAGETAASLAARYISHELDEPVAASDVVLGLLRQRSDEEVVNEKMDAWVAMWPELEKNFARLDATFSYIVAYGLFPSLRPQMSHMEFVAFIKQHGLTPIELAVMVLAGREGVGSLIAWRGPRLRRGG